MAVELVRSAMEKRVGSWACEIGDGEKVWRKKEEMERHGEWRDSEERDMENGETEIIKIKKVV